MSEISSTDKSCFFLNFSCFSIESFDIPKITTLRAPNSFFNSEKSIASLVQPGVSSLG